jgi:hypothetical protein
MKKSVILVIGVAFVLGLATLSLAHTQTRPKPPAHKIFLGTADKVTPADPTKNTKPEIVVKGQANKSMTFVITDTCTFYDAKGGTITFDKIAKGLGVRVTYLTNPQGVHEASSIKLLK